MIHPDWSDEELVQRLQQHDPDALETLMSRYERYLANQIRIVLDGVGTAQDTEECINELFVAVWREMKTFAEKRVTLRKWLTMRAKYIALSRRLQFFRKRTQGENGEIIDP